MRIIYVAVASKGNFIKGPDGRWTIADRVLSSLAELNDKHPDCVFVSPSIQNYSILHLLENGEASDSHSWEVWRSRCIALLRKCEGMTVLCFPGWEESRGVTDEILLCAQMQIPVRYRHFD